MPLGDAVALFGAGERQLLVTTGDLQQAVVVAHRVAAALPPEVEVRSWRDLNQALLFLLRLEKSLMFVAVFLIVVVAAMAVISDLMLIEAHKKSEMGMLGAMGARRASLRRIFLWLGALLVGIGAAVGGSANYFMIRGFAKQADRFFANYDRDFLLGLADRNAMHVHST